MTVVTSLEPTAMIPTALQPASNSSATNTIGPVITVVASRFWRYYARHAHGAGTSRVLVVTRLDGVEVVACYAWSIASITISDAPPRVQVAIPSLSPCLLGWVFRST